MVRGYETLLCVNIFSLIYYLGTDFCGFDLCPAATRNTVENLHKRTLRLSCSRLPRSLAFGFSANERRTNLWLVYSVTPSSKKKTLNGMTCSLFIFFSRAFLNEFVQPRMTRPEPLNRLNKHLIMGITLCNPGSYCVCRLSSLLHVIAATGLFSVCSCLMIIFDFNPDNFIKLL